VSLALAAAVVAYGVGDADRLPTVVAGVGAAGCLLLVVAFAGGWPSVFPIGLAAVGAAYGVDVALRRGDVDPRAPLVAVLFFVAAEIGWWAFEGTSVRGERTVVLRRAGWLVAVAIVTGLVGSLVLVAASAAAGGVALEAAGVGAAVLAIAAIARLVSRPSV
jgi:hypothetical protein